MIREKPALVVALAGVGEALTPVRDRLPDAAFAIRDRITAEVAFLQAVAHGKRDLDLVRKARTHLRCDAARRARGADPQHRCDEEHAREEVR